MKHLLILCLMFTVNAASAQKNLLPSSAKFIRTTPSAPDSEMFDLREQRGVMSYDGKDCTNSEGNSFLEEDNGSRYGNNKWMDVHVHFQRYKPAGKFMFDQIMQYNHPDTELSNKKLVAESDPNENGAIKKTVTIIPVENGKMMVATLVHDCGDDAVNRQYTHMYMYSYAIIGTTIVWIDTAVNTDDVNTLKQMHKQVIDQVKTL